MASDNNTLRKDLGAVSAYAVAVEHGFDGTEAEWEQYIANASMKAKQASESAAAAAQSEADAEIAREAAEGAKVEAQEAAASASAAYGTSMLAPTFSTEVAYAAGDHVIYNGSLYVFNTAHAAGAWDATQASAINLGGEVSDLKSAINDLPKSCDSDAIGVDLDISDGNGNVIMRLKDGHVKTKEFDSSLLLTSLAGKVDIQQETSNAGKALVIEDDGKVAPKDITIDVDDTLTQSGEAADAKAAGDAIRALNSDINKAPTLMNSTETGIDLDVTDANGNVIIRLKNGHIQTKNFDSEELVGRDGSSVPPVVLSSSDGLNIVPGEYCDPLSGIIYDGTSFASFVRSDYLPVLPGDVVRATWCRHYCFFDANQTRVSGGDISALPGYTGSQEENFLTVPSGAAYLIVNFYPEYNTYAVTLEGKGDPEIVIMGDSIYGIAPYPFNPVYYAAKDMRMNIADCAFGGTTASVHYNTDYDKFSFHNIADCIVSEDFSSMADFSGMPPIFKQHRETLENIDWSKVKVVCLAWCTNDWDFGITLDNDQSPTSYTTYMGALRYGMEAIWSVYPQIQFVLFGALYKTVTNDSGHDSDSAVVNGKTLQNFIDGMSSVAKEYHQNFFDHYNIGFNSINASVVFRPDGVHLSYGVGAKILGNRTAKEVELVKW